ncbi:Uncharacterized protein YR821_3490 [Yersinia ruckeri]|uniref:Uncharacterized protein n=1 Tax=Yersinia ruckeri TaxID=29486 RepID=A0A0A8VCX0_YERRU|nr:hypothetical protein yruck0001_28930 [Yersinia ruckeri ATCC 29473]QTD78406.1 Uncharacterized protein YR821_3490 [Yersinia ruckeri]CEK25804.1 hypothetical protein CSF007_0045 [Yersinia ruckeri]
MYLPSINYYHVLLAVIVNDRLNIMRFAFKLATKTEPLKII